MCPPRGGTAEGRGADLVGVQTLLLEQKRGASIRVGVLPGTLKRSVCALGMSYAAGTVALAAPLPLPGHVLVGYIGSCQ